MAQYIDKDALVALIDNKRDRIQNAIYSIPLTGRDRSDATFEYEILGKIEEFLNLIEAKDVDLEKEMNKALDNLTDKDMRGWFRYFFELGFSVGNKAQKGE